MSMQAGTIRYGLIPVEPFNRPSEIEFEMAYQARVPSDRIRFAIKQIKRFTQCSEHMREVGLQLPAALERLDESDRRFQTRSRMAVRPTCAKGMEGES
jgi:hypothetical protein